MCEVYPNIAPTKAIRSTPMMVTAPFDKATSYLSLSLSFLGFAIALLYAASPKVSLKVWAGGPAFRRLLSSSTSTHWVPHPSRSLRRVGVTTLHLPASYLLLVFVPSSPTQPQPNPFYPAEKLRKDGAPSLCGDSKGGPRGGWPTS
jgi:hypothetical protein